MNNEAAMSGALLLMGWPPVYFSSLVCMVR
jgi:hypothetical protein